MSIFEAIMLLCFGAAWPVSIAKSYRSRSTGGKSLAFSLILIAGYISGIVNKIINKPDFVTWLYVLNLVMVSIDAGLWLRNRKLEKQGQTETRA
jgi:hypothetical protein